MRNNEITRRQAIGRGLGGLGGIGLAGIVSNIGAERKAYAQTPSKAIVRTELPETNLIADGTTVYNMNVRADTMAFPGVMFNGAQWVVGVPSYFTVVGANLPDGTNNTQGPSDNPEDFFYNVLMGSYNRVDSVVEGGELGDNVRGTYNVFNGPSDVSDKLLGMYYFSVNTDAPLGEQNSFGLGSVLLVDTSFNTYQLFPEKNLEIQNDIYNIVAAPVADVPAITPAGLAVMGGLAALAGGTIVNKLKKK